jgi:polyisoprenoid-binding protein YceI
MIWPAFAETQTFHIDPTASTARIHVGKTGLASFAGHDHEVLAPSLGGVIAADLDDLARSSVQIIVDAKSLRVLSQGEPPEDVPKIQSAMQGPEVLDVSRFPTIRFRSREVAARQISPGVYNINLTGELAMHGKVKVVTLPLKLEAKPDLLKATGEAVIKQTDFGISPVSAGGGLVKVADEVRLSLQIVARPAH